LRHRCSGGTSDKHANKVLDLHKDGLSYRLIGRNLGFVESTAAAA
jgi:hypothetical protein